MAFTLALLWLPASAHSADSTAADIHRLKSGRDDLLTDLHHPSADRRRDALDQLQRAGTPPSEIQIALGELLQSAEGSVRFRLALAIAGQKGRSVAEVLLDLTHSPSLKVRRTVLPALQGLVVPQPLRLRVWEMATTEPDALVRGYAEMLTAEWDSGFHPSGDLHSRGSRDPEVYPVITDTLVPSPRKATPRGVIARLLSLADSQQQGTPYSEAPADRATHPMKRPSSGPNRLPSAQEVVTTGHAGPQLSPAPIQEPSGPPARYDLFRPPPIDASVDIEGLPAPAEHFLGEGGAVGPARPDVLNRPIIEPEEVFEEPPAEFADGVILAYPFEAPLGFSGPSGIRPSEFQQTSHFVPVEDRWRIGFPEWDRYGKGHPPVDDYPYVEGHWWAPFNQNVLKGDYPVIGQHIFFKLTAEALLIHEYRQLPTPTTPFESTVNPFQEEFFGDPNQYFTTDLLKLSFELFHGNEAFKPMDWLVRVTPIFNINYLDTEELGIVNPDVRKGTTRFDHWVSLEEYFVEAKLADLSPDYDFASVRIGSQPFTSDFRGFIFSDINRGVRLFGTRLANRDQFNIIYFDQVEKDTNSQLNTSDDRHQNTLIANYYRQDFLFPGYTAQISFHYNNDGPSFRFDNNDFLARPDPAGVFRRHEVEAYYVGLTGEGHIGKVNVSNSFYYADGKDSFNPIAGQETDIEAFMAALELSVDRDWIRFRGSFFFASGDDDPLDDEAEGFDAIFDNPNFAGGEFSFWQRQEIRLFGVALVNRLSLVPDLRSSKFQGQSNFVNPGLWLFNLGMDFEVTPKLKLITNANYLMFDQTEVLEAFTFQDDIDRKIGWDLSLGIEYRPLLSDNIIIEGGYAVLIPGEGFDDLYGKTDPFALTNTNDIEADTLHMAFLQLVLLY